MAIFPQWRKFMQLNGNFIIVQVIINTWHIQELDPCFQDIHLHTRYKTTSPKIAWWYTYDPQHPGIQSIQCILFALKD